MKKISVKNFGPIKTGFEENDGFFCIPKLTVFIGNQGTGKSTIAKLISTFSWLEKSLYRNELSEKEVVKNSRFANEFCAYQGIQNYFLDNTEIAYQGDVFSFKYSNQKLKITESKKNAKYPVPKIMYVPAERNFLSVVLRPERLKGLPKPLYTFLEEFERSQQELSGELDLPINQLKFQYNKRNKTPYISGENHKIKLSEASSGIQSLLPAFLVSRNLALSIDKKKDASTQKLSREQQQKIKEEVEGILANNQFSEEVRNAALEVLSARYQNAAFVNIVEEIEQNLFPKSQRQLLYKMLEFVNYTAANQLILTTHSPYIVNFLTLAIKGSEVYEKGKKRGIEESLEIKLNKIIPIKSLIAANQTVIYKTTEEGVIEKLPTYEGLPSDDNYLNEFLALGNEQFDELLEIEEML